MQRLTSHFVTWRFIATSTGVRPLLTFDITTPQLTSFGSVVGTGGSDEVAHATRRAPQAMHDRESRTGLRLGNVLFPTNGEGDYT